MMRIGWQTLLLITLTGCDPEEDCTTEAAIPIASEYANVCEDHAQCGLIEDYRACPDSCVCPVVLALSHVARFEEDWDAIPCCIDSHRGNTCTCADVFPRCIDGRCIDLLHREEPGDFGMIPSAPIPTVITPADRECTGPNQCIVVDEDCCDCNSGTTEGFTAINQSALAAVEERRTTECGVFACPSAMSMNPTCCATGAACIEGRCEVIGPLGTWPGRFCEQ
jgi:hypothetical protein